MANSHALSEPTEINGYRIGRLIHGGGFGLVYEAECVSERTRALAISQLGTRRIGTARPITIALKELFPAALVERVGTTVRLTGDPAIQASVLKKFVAESQFLTTSILDDPAILKGVELFLANGTAYFAMELVRGQTLDAWLAADRATRSAGPGESRLRAMFEPVFDALEKLHRLDHMHRDIKPANILRRDDGSLVLIDFGLVGEGLGRDRAGSTTIVAGTPRYAPPEQFGLPDCILDGRRVSFATQGRYTDVYALAAVLYRAITGTAPPAGEQRVATASRPGGLDPLDRSGLDAAPRFAAGILAGLELDPARRPQDVSAFREALGWTTPTERQVDGPQDSTILLPPERENPTIRLPPKPGDDGGVRGGGDSRSGPSRRGLLLAGLGLVAAAATGAGYVWSRRSAGDGPPPVPLAVSRDARTAAVVGADGRLALVDLAGGPRRAVSFARAAAVAVTPDGRRFAAAAADGQLAVIDAATAAVRPLSATGRRPTGLATDGTRIAVGSDDGRVALIDAGDGHSLADFAAHGAGPVLPALAEIGGRLATGGADGAVKLWTLPSATPLRTLRASGPAIVALALTPDGSRLYAAAADGSLEIWDVEPAGAQARRFAAVEGGVGVLAVAPDASRFATGGASNGFAVWDLTGEAVVARTDGQSGRLAAVAFPLDGSRPVSLGADGSLSLWDLGRSDRPTGTLPPA